MTICRILLDKVYKVVSVVIQYSSVTQSCPTLCNPMDSSIPGFPLHHQLLELAQIHVRQVSDAIQPSHPLSSPSPPTFNLSQHQCLFQWVSSSHQVGQSIGASASASFLWMNTKDWFPLGLTGLISLQSKRLSRVFSNTTVRKHQFFSTQLFLWSNSHIPYMTTGKTTSLPIRTFVSKVMSLLFNMLSRFVIAFFQGASVF